MAPRTPPSWLQAGSHPAEHDRLHQMSIFGSPAASFTGGVSALDPAHGIDNPAALKVTALGTPAMKVNVDPGGCFIRGTLAATQGAYHGYNDAIYEITLASPDGTNARRDLIVARVRDSAYSGASDNFTIEAVTGTPSGSPADPTVPANCLVLARVQVNASPDSTIVTGDITDLRTFARNWNDSWGELPAAYAAITADTAAIGASYVDINQAALTFVTPPGRKIETRLYLGRVIQIAGAGEPSIICTDGSNVQKQNPWSQYLGGANFTASPYLPIRELGLSGSVTRKFRAFTTGATLTVKGTTHGGFVSVVDLGPA